MAIRRPQIMGIVNVTPDSFSDGGRLPDVAAAVGHALRLEAEGADILDIGGESTRPGAAPVSEAEELDRVIPVIEALKRRSGAALSIDTLKPSVARAAIRAGAAIWNDVTALTGAPESLAMAAELGCGVVLMHMKGDPSSMNALADYGDVTAEVCAHLLARAQAAEAAGVKREAIWLDPGIGFAKTAEHSMTLMRDLETLVALGYPVVLGASRKSFLKAIDPSAETAGQRLAGSLAAAIRGAEAGCAVVRVHDVAETRQALDAWAAMRA
ncbi:MAG: dihydropteroate synthase [Caulobacteraceae bacterium]